MTWIISILLALILAFLALEQRRALRERKHLRHIVYVNGIRGKSTVTRLIDAGLRAGGYKVFCKTTGTVPMTIGTDNIARPLHRRGRANIKEQLQILHQASLEGAEILVLECMAVDPQLQWVTQHKMLRSDIGVITNVRLDHTAEMGETLEQICNSLSGTIPEGGHLFTADEAFFSQLRANSAALGTTAELVLPTGKEPAIDFPENLALALAVCRHLGVSEEAALSGMQRYQPDPYALSLHRLPGGGIFVNGMSINDPQSTQLVYERLAGEFGWSSKDLTLLINNRPDRGYRTEHMMLVAKALRPREVWLLGASQRPTARKLHRDLPEAVIRPFVRAADVPLQSLPEGSVIFSVGNVAGPGHDIMHRIREEGEEYVSGHRSVWGCHQSDLL